jgi:AraC-like DNA-binding protein
MIAKFEQKKFLNSAHCSAHKYKNLNNLPHWHMEHELICVRNGVLELTLNQQTFTLSSGMFAFIKGEEIHCYKGTPDSIADIIQWDADYFKAVVGKKNLLEPLLRQTSLTEKTYQELSAELEGNAEYGNFIADCIAGRLLAEIFRQEETVLTNTKKKISQKYKDLLGWINATYTDVTFEDAAAYLCLSKPYFSKLFQQLAGMTFTQYLNTLKVTAAAEKLTEGKMSVTEISSACGFGTIRNFNRVFKELTGYSPKQLPKDYIFIHSLRHPVSVSFDPTLDPTERLE